MLGISTEKESQELCEHYEK